MNMNKNITGERFILSVFLVLFVVIFATGVLASGVWVEPSFSGHPSCNAQNHVMCSEYSTNLNFYNPHPDFRNISYTNLSTDRTFQFCAIVDNPDGACHFDMINGSHPDNNIFSLADLKNWSGLCGQNTLPLNLDGVGPMYYDMNCNGDELFEMGPYGRLDTTRYIENGVTFDVWPRQSNIAYFDIISKIDDNNIGGIIQGTVTSVSGVPIENANVTLFFKNTRGTFIPYRSFLTDENGFYSTFVNTNITTYFSTYNTSTIPLTDYILTVRHPEFLEFSGDVPLGVPVDGTLYPGLRTYNVTLDPVNVCQPDCTFIGSNICRQECDGINDCSFRTIVGTDISLAPYLHGVLRGSVITREIEVSGVNNTYTIEACEGPALLSDSLIDAQQGPTCPEDQELWRTERIVRLNGQIRRMVVTLCQ
ncbi:MAG: carboxypeptidase-like regulatory domain-containing protein [Candidatus Woesearchaeota archaeon]